MELRLEIVSFQKTLMGDAQSHVFDASGGSIGRGRDNSWVLPDPNRYVSSRHAEIDCVDGRFRITDVSTNGVFLNGSATALGRDGRATLSDGDRLVMGDYEIAVRLQGRVRPPDRATPVPSPRSPLAFGSAPPQDAPDILDVVSRRRTEPRFGPLDLPDEPVGFRPPPASVPDRPLPPPPPRPAARPVAAQPPAMQPAAARPAPPPGIPDDVDLTAAPASAPPLPPAPPTVPAAARPVLPDDLDDLLPGGPADRPPLRTPPRDTLPQSHLPRPTLPQPALPDDLDDLLPEPATRQDARPASRPADALPDGVPLLRPIPGTGNRREPLSPAPAAEAPPASLPPSTEPAAPDGRPPAAHTAPVQSAAADAGLAGAIAAGLGLDPRTLAGLDQRAVAETVARAARAAALGVAGAIDARNALARAAGVDARELGSDDDNPFLTYRSGEAALRHCVTGAAPGHTLDKATRDSVAALTVTAGAAAVALDAVLDRLAAEGPPGSAERAREIFGAAFLNAYHRETKRAN